MVFSDGFSLAKKRRIGFIGWKRRAPRAEGHNPMELSQLFMRGYCDPIYFSPVGSIACIFMQCIILSHLSHHDKRYYWWSDIGTEHWPCWTDLQTTWRQLQSSLWNKGISTVGSSNSLDIGQARQKNRWWVSSSSSSLVIILLFLPIFFLQVDFVPRSRARINSNNTRTILLLTKPTSIKRWSIFRSRILLTVNWPNSFDTPAICL